MREFVRGEVVSFKPETWGARTYPGPSGPQLGPASRAVIRHPIYQRRCYLCRADLAPRQAAADRGGSYFCLAHVEKFEDGHVHEHRPSTIRTYEEALHAI